MGALTIDSRGWLICNTIFHHLWLLFGGAFKPVPQTRSYCWVRHVVQFRDLFMIALMLTNCVTWIWMTHLIHIPSSWHAVQKYIWAYCSTKIFLNHPQSTFVCAIFLFKSQRKVKLNSTSKQFRFHANFKRKRSQYDMYVFSIRQLVWQW